MKLCHYGRETIIVNNSTFSFGEFSKLEPFYSVPWGFPIRVYEKGVKHYISDGSNTLYLPINDPYCDAICQREGELLRLLERMK